jgi:hypothetical protein
MMRQAAAAAAAAAMWSAGEHAGSACCCCWSGVFEGKHAASACCACYWSAVLRCFGVYGMYVALIAGHCTCRLHCNCSASQQASHLTKSRRVALLLSLSCTLQCLCPAVLKLLVGTSVYLLSVSLLFPSCCAVKQLIGYTARSSAQNVVARLVCHT